MKRKIWPWLLLIMIVVLLFLTRRPVWPKQEKSPNVEGIQRQCKITRDTWDVPHIQADSDPAGFYCWGYTQAADRVWQMDFLRRTAYGKMAEVYGFSYVRQDFFFRLLDIASVAKRLTDNLPSQSPETHRLLRFFVWGVNDAFEKVRRTPYNQRPYALRDGQPIEPWNLQDTVVVMLLQSFFQTNKSFLDDLSHARLRVLLGKDRYNALYEGTKKYRTFDESIIKQGEHSLVPAPSPSQPASQPASPRPSSPQTPTLRRPSALQQPPSPASLPTLHRHAPPTSRPALSPQNPNTPPTSRPAPSGSPLPRGARGSLLRALDKVLAFFPPDLANIGQGSNSWVVAPARSQSGHAMLANDPHLRITIPSFWHEVHIRTPNFNAMGVAVPGGPFVISGNNEHVSWGVTNGYTNVADLTPIKLDRQGRFHLGKKAYQSQHISPTVYARSGPLYVPIFWQRFRTTPLGPILPIPWPKERILLLQWSGLSLTIHPFIGLFQLLKAKDARDVDRIFQHVQTPCFNLVFADTKGQIGYRQVGLLPRRLAGQRGLINPDDPREFWLDFLKPHEVPFLLQPKRGFIVTANNRTFPPNYPFYTGDSFTLGFRAKRIETLLQARPKHTPETFQAIQNDTYVPDAQILLDLMLGQLHLALGKDLPDPLTSEAIRILQRWDRRADLEQIAPTIFRTWLNHFEKTAFQTDRVAPPTAAILALLRGQLKAGNTQTTPQILKNSFAAALQQLKKHLSPNIQTWHWKRFHSLTMKHLLNTTEQWNPPPLPVYGDTETVSPASSLGKGPFYSEVMASYRLVTEMRPGRIRSWGVLAGRQIDRDPLKPSEQLRLWHKGQYRPRPFYPDQIQKHKKADYLIKF